MRSWHATWSAEGRHPLAPGEGHRRALVGAIGRVAGDAVSFFCVVDDHVHVVLFCGEAERGRYVQALSLAFRPLAAVRLEPAGVRPVRDRGHMEWLADEYVVRQPAKHGLAGHPALWSGSCFADLVQARVVPGLRLRVGDALPRWRLRKAYAALGLPESPIQPASDEAVRRAGAARVAAAAAFATGADPALAGKGAPEVLARRTAAALADAVGIGAGEVAWALKITPRAGRRLADREVPAAVSRAARMRLALEDACAAAPMVLREPDGAVEGDYGSA